MNPVIRHELVAAETRAERAPKAFGGRALTREEVFAALARGAVHAKALQKQMEDLRPTAATMSLILGAFLLVLGNLATPLVTKAQDPLPLPLPLPSVELPAVGDTIALDVNARAPWAGMLVRDEDLFALQSSLMTTRLALDNAHRLYVEALAGRGALLEAAERSCVERVVLHDSLWRERRDELAASLAEARGREADGPAWFVHPATWFIVGALAGGVLVGSVVSLLK